MVYRVFVEKKPALAFEAEHLLADARSLLGVTGLERVRIVNRYDVENITPELFDYAVRTVFSEPQLDTTSETIDVASWYLRAGKRAHHQPLRRGEHLRRIV